METHEFHLPFIFIAGLGGAMRTNEEESIYSLVGYLGKRTSKSGILSNHE